MGEIFKIGFVFFNHKVFITKLYSLLNCNDYNFVMMVETMDRFVEILRQHDLKITPQRLEILRYLDGHRTHPTADQIYIALKKKNPSLSKTTVYNSLETLKDHGLVVTLTICGHEKHYDLRTETHHHFFCKKCKKIIDIDLSCPNLENLNRFGHQVDEVHGYFKGVCKDCIDEGGELNES